MKKFDSILSGVQKLTLLIGGWILFFNDQTLEALVCFVGLIILNEINFHNKKGDV